MCRTDRGCKRTSRRSATNPFAFPGDPGFAWNLPLLIGAAMVLLSIGLTFAAPWLTAHDPLEIADASLSPPSSQYLLGTDQLGRDVLTRILYAARSSLAVACLSAALAFVSGT